MQYSIRTLPLSLILTLGCSTAAPTSHPVDQQESIHRVTRLPLELGWSPRQIATSKQYLIQDSTVISTATGTPQTRVTQTNATYSIRINRLGESLFIAAKQDSLITLSQFPFSKPTLNFNTVQSFHAILSLTGQISSLTQDSTSSCSEGITPAGTRIYDLVISYPTKMMQVGDGWTDTVSTTVCRGKNRLSQQAIRTYLIIGFTTWNQQPAVAIKRLIISTFNTNSRQIPSQFSANGSGRSLSFISVDRATGALLQSNTQLESKLTISTSRGLFPFTQVVETHMNLR